MKTVRLLLFSFLVFPISLSCSTEHTDQIGDIEKIIKEISEADSTSQKSEENGTSRPYNPFDGYEKHIVEAFKRAQQFTDIIWESQGNIPSVKSGSYDAGEHKGMPYSLANEYNKYIGFDVSIKTFMTALHNKHSLLYTENISAKNSKSSYGIKYQGDRYYCATYMGTVCSFFVSYVLGQKIPYHVYEYGAMEKMGVVEKIEDQSINGIQIMDIILESGHVSIITNVNRTSSGEIVNLTWSESEKPYMKSTVMYPLEFKSRLEKKKGTIYRFKDWANSQAYKASEFVATYGESVSDYKYNDDICTFAGDEACFREGDIIVIDYRKGQYTDMEICKDNQLIETIPLSADAADYAINLTDRNLTFGTYKARLTNGKSHSDYTYFEILQADVTFENYENHQKISFHSENGTPIYIQFCDRQGTSYGKYALNHDDILNGYTLVDAKSILEFYRNTTTFTKDVYLKVFFQGKYGRVTNHFLKTNLH